jgi:hypothetical protein
MPHKRGTFATRNGGGQTKSGLLRVVFSEAGKVVPEMGTISLQR